jgi:hypothetical protein
MSPLVRSADIPAKNIAIYFLISYSTDASTKAKSVSNYLNKLGIDSFVFEKNLDRDFGNHQAQIRDEIEASNSVYSYCLPEVKIQHVLHMS